MNIILDSGPLTRFKFSKWSRLFVQILKLIWIDLPVYVVWIWVWLNTIGEGVYHKLRAGDTRKDEASKVFGREGKIMKFLKSCSKYLKNLRLWWKNNVEHFKFNVTQLSLFDTWRLRGLTTYTNKSSDPN